MVVASGFIEANAPDALAGIEDELAARKIEVNDRDGQKITFLIERGTLAGVKSAIEALKDIDGVRNVYLTYYSMEMSENET